MGKFKLSFVVLLLLTAHLSGQPVNDLQKINIALQDKYIQTQTINSFIPQLQAIENKVIINKDSQQIAINIFLNASLAYARVLHFKQGLYTFQGYLSLKNKFGALNKQHAIDSLIALNKLNQSRQDKNILEKKSALSQLELDIESWSKMNSKFSRNYSLAIIILTAVLALVFIRINMLSAKAKKSLTQNREQLLALQRMAMLGNFYPRANDFLISSCDSILSKTHLLLNMAEKNGSAEKNLVTEDSGKLLREIASSEQALKNLL